MGIIEPPKLAECRTISVTFSPMHARKLHSDDPRLRTGALRPFLRHQSSRIHFSSRKMPLLGRQFTNRLCCSTPEFERCWEMVSRKCYVWSNSRGFSLRFLNTYRKAVKCTRFASLLGYACLVKSDDEFWNITSALAGMPLADTASWYLQRNLAVGKYNKVRVVDDI